MTSTRTIMRRVEAALSYDLLGSYTEDTTEKSDADSAVNGHLSDPLNSSPVAERVDRYVVDPLDFGDLYMSQEKTGVTVGYSFGSDQAEGPRTGTGRGSRRRMPVEITYIRVVSGAEELIGGAPAYAADDIMDDVLRVFTPARRDAPRFGVENVSVEPVRRLEGGGLSVPWAGRTTVVHFVRSVKDLHTS